MITLTHAQWLAEAEKRYGKSLRYARFRCPACGHAQSGEDFISLGIEPEAAIRYLGFSCIGRVMDNPVRDAFGAGPGPCNYAGGGLIGLNPICVKTDEDEKEYHVFDFADEPLADKRPSVPKTEKPPEEGK